MKNLYLEIISRIMIVKKHGIIFIQIKVLNYNENRQHEKFV